MILSSRIDKEPRKSIDDYAIFRKKEANKIEVEDRKIDDQKSVPFV